MAKPSEELSKIRGERVKALLQANKWTQGQLAEKMHTSVTALNAKLNGKRSLTEEDAEIIAQLFPPTRKGWILGIEQDRTQAVEILRIIEESGHQSALVHAGFKLLASAIGYEITFPLTIGGIPGRVTADKDGMINAEDAVKSVKQGYEIAKGEESVTLSIEQMNSFLNKLYAHIEVELKYLFP